jgi:hypothetical protein
LIGGSIDASLDSSNVIIAELDSTGNELWSKQYEGASSSDSDGINSIAQTTDGAIVAAGWTNMKNVDPLFVMPVLGDAAVLKLDSIGNCFGCSF